jgi:hypothetical protein
LRAEFDFSVFENKKEAKKVEVNYERTRKKNVSATGFELASVKVKSIPKG